MKTQTDETKIEIYAKFNWRYWKLQKKGTIIRGYEMTIINEETLNKYFYQKEQQK